MIEKIDFRKKYKEVYKASEKRVSKINMPSLRYLSIEGKGDPSSSKIFTNSIEALYSVAYSFKFYFKDSSIKKPEGYYDYIVPPLDCLWWMDGQEFDVNIKDEWRFKLMIPQAEYFTEEYLSKAKDLIRKKKNILMLENLKLIKLNEKQVAQIMHIGPYENLKNSYQKLSNIMYSEGLTPKGSSHETYLSDPRRVKPEKYKTIIRLEY